MNIRIGKVTGTSPITGKLKVSYEDTGNASMELAMMTMNQEYSMPEVGDKVVTVHLDNGSSKGFVLGTYYGGGSQPKASSGYRKDFTSGAFATSQNGNYVLRAKKVNISSSVGANVTLSANASLVGEEVLIGSAAQTEDENEESDPEVYLRITDEDAELKSAMTVEITAEEGAATFSAAAEVAKLTLDTETTLEARSVTVSADDITLECSYGSITVEEMMKRIERLEDEAGLPHTID